MNYALLFLGADYTPFVLSGQIWRVVMSAFLHGGLLHLGLNLYALYIVSTFIERFYGRRKVLIIYVIGAIGGSLASLLADIVGMWSSGGVEIISSMSVGASGAIFAMVGALIGSKLKKSTYEPQLNVDPNQLISVVIYNLLIGVGINLVGGGVYINIWAHFGGLAAGILLGAFLSSVNSFYESKARKIFTGILFYGSLIFLALSFLAQIFFILSNIFTF